MDMRLRSAPSPEQWMKYEQAPMAKQRKVLQEYEDELQDVSIKDPDGIQAGDHVVCKRSFMFGSIKYYHHMLCIGRSGDDVEVIEYNGPNKLRISPASKCLFFKDLGLKGKVMKQVYSVQDFMKKKVRKRVWPEKLKRYSVKEATERAGSRINETCYGIFSNNCEHLVSWSICGLKVSFQVKRRHHAIRECIYAGFASLLHFIRNEILHGLITAMLKASKVVADFISKNVLYLGIGLAILMEAVFALYEILKTLKHHRSSPGELKARLARIFSKTLCRLGFGIASSFLGKAVGSSAKATLVGGILGSGIGHLFGAAIGLLYELHLSKKQ